MLQDKKIAFIGSGAMGEAMIGGMLVEQVTTSAQIIAGEPAEARRTHMAETHGIQTTADNLEAISLY